MPEPNATSMPDQYPPEDRDILLGTLFKNKKELIARQFQNRGIPLSARSTKRAMRLAVESHLSRGKLDLNDIHSMLIGLEGWGHQQIYMYKYSGGETIQRKWLDEEAVACKIHEHGLRDFYNVSRSITAPLDTRLYTITYNPDLGRIRFVWVERRTVVERDESRDMLHSEFEANEDSTAHERIIYRAYRETLTRDISSFEWDIRRGIAMIMIRKLSGTKYPVERDRILVDLEDILPILDFYPYSISRLVNKIRLARDEKIVIRAAEVQSMDNGAIIRLASSNQDDVRDDAVVEETGSRISTQVNGRACNFLVELRRNKKIRFELYAKKSDDQRIGIDSQELEDDIRNALQIIGTYLQ